MAPAAGQTPAGFRSRPETTITRQGFGELHPLERPAPRNAAPRRGADRTHRPPGPSRRGLRARGPRRAADRRRTARPRRRRPARARGPRPRPRPSSPSCTATTAAWPTSTTPTWRPSAPDPSVNPHTRRCPSSRRSACSRSSTRCCAAPSRAPSSPAKPPAVSWYSLTCTPVDATPDGQDGGVLVFATDVTDHAEAAERLRASERRQRETAVTLQRSLLPQELEDPDLRVAATYQPGGTEAAVGGGWYNVITLGGGRTALVIGDVMGRGVRAAAVMGQLRTAVRAYARLDLPARGPATPRRTRHGDRRRPGSPACASPSTTPTRGGHHLRGPPPDPRPRRARHRDPRRRTHRTTARHRRLDARLGLGPAGSRLHGRPLHRRPGRAPRRGPRRGDRVPGARPRGGDGHAPGRLRPPRPLPRASPPTTTTTWPSSSSSTPPVVQGPDGDLFRNAALELLGGVEAAPRARAFASGVLTSWRFPSDLHDLGVLATSELVANSLQHGTPPMRLRLRRTDRRLIIEVTDGDDHLPRPAPRRARRRGRPRYRHRRDDRFRLGVTAYARGRQGGLVRVRPPRTGPADPCPGRVPREAGDGCRHGETW